MQHSFNWMFPFIILNYHQTYVFLTWGRKPPRSGWLRYLPGTIATVSIWIGSDASRRCSTTTVGGTRCQPSTRCRSAPRGTMLANQESNEAVGSFCEAVMFQKRSPRGIGRGPIFQKRRYLSHTAHRYCLSLIQYLQVIVNGVARLQIHTS